MKTQRFVLATGTDAWSQAGMWTVLLYEEGTDAGGQTAVIRVRSIQGGNQVDVECKPGRQVRLSQPVDGIVITSLTGNAITGKISLGAGDVRDSSLLGTVEVVDGGKARTKAGAAFLAQVYCPLLAGYYAMAQIFNPASSGKNAVISQIMVASASAVGVTFKTHNAALANVAGQANPVSKMVGGAASVMANYYQRANPIPALTPGATLPAIYAPANRTETLRLTEPIVLPPGYGLVGYVATALDTDLNLTAEFTEEAV